MLRFDFINLDRAEITAEGWIRDKPVLTRAGVFEYKQPNGKIQREWRPPEEVFHADHLASFAGVPITVGHPGRVSATNTAAIIGTVLGAGERQDTNALAPLVIHAPSRMGAHRDLSLGYSVDMDETPGITPDGERYDAIQRNLKINHCAVVERGRAGTARLRLDRQDAADASVVISNEETMSDLKLTVLRLDGIEYQASPEVAKSYEKLEAALNAKGDALKAASSRADGIEAERDTLKAALAKHEASLPQLRADAMADVRARLVLEATATKHGVEVRADMADRAVREAVVTKLAPNVYKFDGKEESYIEHAFDRVTADADKVKDVAASNRAIVNGGAVRVDAAINNTGMVRSNAELRSRLARTGNR